MSTPLQRSFAKPALTPRRRAVSFSNSAGDSTTAMGCPDYGLGLPPLLLFRPPRTTVPASSLTRLLRSVREISLQDFQQVMAWRCFQQVRRSNAFSNPRMPPSLPTECRALRATLINTGSASVDRSNDPPAYPPPSIWHGRSREELAGDNFPRAAVTLLSQRRSIRHFLCPVEIAEQVEVNFVVVPAGKPDRASPQRFPETRVKARPRLEPL